MKTNIHIYVLFYTLRKLRFGFIKDATQINSVIHLLRMTSKHTDHLFDTTASYSSEIELGVEKWDSR